MPHSYHPTVQVPYREVGPLPFRSSLFFPFRVCTLSRRIGACEAGINSPGTETAYIREKHREISPAVFTRKAVGSLSNCVACHRSAEKGMYDDDDVVIPR
ncbi:MAG: hypothetical protein HY788_18195 [Deltaproteobacteria bacterium]|nr:hypothetical protein [Deltaproteobacteria bacterium]